MNVENDETGDYPDEEYSEDDSYAADQLQDQEYEDEYEDCLLYTSPSPRDKRQSRMPSSA